MPTERGTFDSNASGAFVQGRTGDRNRIRKDLLIVMFQDHATDLYIPSGGLLGQRPPLPLFFEDQAAFVQARDGQRRSIGLWIVQEYTPNVNDVDELFPAGVFWTRPSDIFAGGIINTATTSLFIAALLAPLGYPVVASALELQDDGFQLSVNIFTDLGRDDAISQAVAGFNPAPRITTTTHYTERRWWQQAIAALRSN